MAIPRIFRGAGIGGVTGGGAAAATGDQNQTTSQRVGRGILGGMAGSLAGAGIHGGLRYKKLKNMDIGSVASDGAGGIKYKTKKLSKDDAATEALFGTERSSEVLKRQAAENKALKDTSGTLEELNARQKTQQAAEAVKAFEGNPNNRFKNMDYRAAKKLYRQQARATHPDHLKAKGATPEELAAAQEKFDKIQQDWNAYEAAHEMGKAASGNLDYLIFKSFFNNLLDKGDY